MSDLSLARQIKQRSRCAGEIDAFQHCRLSSLSWTTIRLRNRLPQLPRLQRHVKVFRILPMFALATAKEAEGRPPGPPGPHEDHLHALAQGCPRHASYMETYFNGYVPFTRYVLHVSHVLIGSKTGLEIDSPRQPRQTFSSMAAAALSLTVVPSTQAGRPKAKAGSALALVFGLAPHPLHVQCWRGTPRGS